MILKHMIRGDIALVGISVGAGFLKLIPWRGAIIITLIGAVAYNLIFGWFAYVCSKGTYDTETDTLEWNDETN